MGFFQLAAAIFFGIYIFPILAQIFFAATALMVTFFVLTPYGVLLGTLALGIILVMGITSLFFIRSSKD